MFRAFFRFILGITALVIVALVALGAYAFLTPDFIDSRTELLALKRMNVLSGYGWKATVTSMASLQGDVVSPAYRRVRVKSPNEAQLTRGATLFSQHCSTCHEQHAGEIAPDLADPTIARGLSQARVYSTVSLGIEGTAMAAFDLDVADKLALAVYVDANYADKTKVVQAKTTCDKCANVSVTQTDLLDGMNVDDGSWPTYSGDYSGKRHITHTDFTAESLNDARVRWIYQFEPSATPVESQPIVADGVMFVTGPDNEVVALDLDTGTELWLYDPNVPENPKLCCGRVNRGVALWNDLVFHNTLDSRLIALRAADGSVVWEKKLADPAQGYSMTGAPLAVDGKIIVGFGGGEFDIRGAIEAYDAQSGEQLWRFATAPGENDPGIDSWTSTAGFFPAGGGTWLTGTYDPELQLLYWGTGNPYPSVSGQVREGDNLFTSSVVALDVNTGTLKWHFQFTPHDLYDWDANQIPVLVDAEYKGSERKLLLTANRNCFFYVLDRSSGEFLDAFPYCHQTWNDGFESDGRPIWKASALPKETGSVVFPGPLGGSNWFSPTYHPGSEYFFVTFRDDQHEYYRGTCRNGKCKNSRFVRMGDGVRRSGVLAIKWRERQVAWEYVEDKFLYSGLTSTASDLVFAVLNGGRLAAFNVNTGEIEWEMRIGAYAKTAPISYAYQGRQELAVASGNAVIVIRADETTTAPGPQ